MDGRWVKEAIEVMEEGNPALLQEMKARPLRFSEWKASLEREAEDLFLRTLWETKEAEKLPAPVTYQEQAALEAQARATATSLVRETLIRPLGIQTVA